MRNQHALLSKLLPLPLLLFFSLEAYAQSDRDPRRDISVGFGSKLEGKDAGSVFGTLTNNSANTYPCVRIEFGLFTRFDLRPQGQKARHLGVLPVVVQDLQPRSVRDYEQRLPFPAGFGLKSVSECTVPPTSTVSTDTFIETVIPVHGLWSAGGRQTIPIMVLFTNSLKVSMRAFKRPTAHGSILNATTIKVTFPDDKTYTGILQPPNMIRWSNGTVWRRVGDIEG